MRLSPIRIAGCGEVGDVRALLRARRRAVPADAGSALPLPLLQARRGAGPPPARPQGVERLRLHHRRRGDGEDDAPARLPGRARTRGEGRLHHQPGALHPRALAAHQPRVRPARDEHEPDGAGRYAQRAPARAAPGRSRLGGRGRRGAGVLDGSARAAPPALEPGDRDREAPPRRARRPAAAAHAAPRPRHGAAEPAHHTPLAHGAAPLSRDGGLRAPPPRRRQRRESGAALHRPRAPLDAQPRRRRTAPHQHDRTPGDARGVRRAPAASDPALRRARVPGDQGRAAAGRRSRRSSPASRE